MRQSPLLEPVVFALRLGHFPVLSGGQEFAYVVVEGLAVDVSQGQHGCVGLIGLARVKGSPLLLLDFLFEVDMLFLTL